MLLVVDVTPIAAVTTDMVMHRDLVVITVCGLSFFCAAAADVEEKADSAAVSATDAETTAASGSSFFCAAVVDSAANRACNSTKGRLPNGWAVFFYLLKPCFIFFFCLLFFFLFFSSLFLTHSKSIS